MEGANYIEIEGAPGIYKIVNPEGQIYIGSSNNVSRRLNQHKRQYEKSNSKLLNSLKKYGTDKHVFEVVEYCDIKDIYRLERTWGDYYETLDRLKGLNLMLPGYDEVKTSMSEETKRKIGLKHKGKILSESHKKAFAKSLVGTKQSQAHIDKRKMFGKNNPAYGNEYFKGETHSKETRLKISEAVKGTNLGGKNHKAKKVIDNTNGFIYGSAKDVSNKFGINYSTLRAWLQEKNKNDGRFEYVK